MGHQVPVSCPRPGSGRGFLGCSLWALQGLSPLGPLPLDSWVGGGRQPCSFLLHLLLSVTGDQVSSAGARWRLSPGRPLLKLLALAGCLFGEPGLGVTGTSLPGQVELSAQLQPLGKSLWCVLGLPGGPTAGKQGWFLSEETQDKIFNSRVPGPGPGLGPEASASRRSGSRDCHVWVVQAWDPL